MSRQEIYVSEPDEDVLSDAFFEARKNDLAKRLRHERFEHAIGVSKTAETLAQAYGADVRAARLAGLLHDWDKSYDNEGIRRRALELGLEADTFVFKEMPQLLHGPTAAAALKQDFPQLPPEVVRAIERHTAGAVGMGDLDMVDYIADALEPGRSYEGLVEVRSLIGSVSLEELYVATYQHIFLNLIKRRKRVHPASVDIWNYYLARTRKTGREHKRKGQCERNG